ncbi:FG-GAP repeat protein [Nannocystis pusilla]|uniref:FG-GAP repeat protein n=1 Tax=Nannocystis pusilla TaxID=889268 RepID=UPI003B8300C3
MVADGVHQGEQHSVDCRSGRSLALSADGKTLVAGAPYEDSAATGVDGDPRQGVAENSGAAYVYYRDEGGWTQRAYLKASNSGSGDHFGHAVALSGDGTTLAVGAMYERSKSAGINGDQLDDSVMSGAAYVFTLKDALWSQQAYIKASESGHVRQLRRIHRARV